jgi:hypothetical protein
MSWKVVGSLGVSACALTLNGAARASETVTYSYDALGRLVAISTSGGPNSGQNVRTCYDPAGNRTSYTVATGTPPAPCPPPPPLPPGSAAYQVRSATADA